MVLSVLPSPSCVVFKNWSRFNRFAPLTVMFASVLFSVSTDDVVPPESVVLAAPIVRPWPAPTPFSREIVLVPMVRLV